MVQRHFDTQKNVFMLLAGIIGAHGYQNWTVFGVPVSPSSVWAFSTYIVLR